MPQRQRKVAGLENSIFQIWPSPNPVRTEAAWRFAKFYLARENQVRAIVEAGSSPVCLAAYSDPRVQQFLKESPSVAVSQNAYQYGRFDARIAQYPTMALEYLGVRPFVPLDNDFNSYLFELKYGIRIRRNITLTPRFNYKRQSPWQCVSDTCRELGYFYGKTAERISWEPYTVL